MSPTGRLRRATAGTEDATLRLAARLLLGGQLLFIVITQFHTGGDANDHSSIFARYADSGDWKGVHALQFGAVAVVVAGLVVLDRAALMGRAAPAMESSHEEGGGMLVRPVKPAAHQPCS